MKKSTIALLAVGGSALVVVSVIAGMVLYLVGINLIGLSRSSGYEEEPVNEDIMVVEDSVEWKLISQSDEYGNNSRISFKVTLRNPTSEDIQVRAFDLRIWFFDSEGFALERHNYADEFTVPANGEYTYSAPHGLRGGLGEQVAYIEVLGVRSK